MIILPLGIPKSGSREFYNDLTRGKLNVPSFLKILGRLRHRIQLESFIVFNSICLHKFYYNLTTITYINSRSLIKAEGLEGTLI